MEEYVLNIGWPQLIYIVSQLAAFTLAYVRALDRSEPSYNISDFIDLVGVSLLFALLLWWGGFFTVPICNHVI